MSTKSCPFTRLLNPSLNIVPIDAHAGSGAGGGPSSPTAASGLVTPSFAPNSPADHLPEDRITISSIVAAINHAPAASFAQELDVEDVLLPEELVWSEPISKLLKVGTARAHQDAETSGGAEALVKGQLELQEYIRWNAILWRVYNALELGLTEHQDNSVLSSTFDPATLARSDLIAKDIRHLLTLLPTSTTSAALTLPSSNSITSPSEPLPPFPLPSFLSPLFTNPPPGLSTYISHLRALARSRPEGLLAHAYVRYLGDMSGGQFIVARVRRAYALPKVQGSEFYHFYQDGKWPAEGDAEESMADARRRLGDIKDWYRRGMDEGVAEDEKLKKYLVKEANLAFALNTHLFALIQPPSTTPEAEAATGVLNKPLDPKQPHKRYYELKQEQKGPAPAPQSWREYAGRFAFAAAAVVLGQVVARYGAPYIKSVYSDLSARSAGTV